MNTRTIIRIRTVSSTESRLTVQCLKVFANQYYNYLNIANYYDNITTIYNKYHKGGYAMNKKQNKAYVCSIIIGIVLLLIGLIIQIPGGALTTYEIMDGNLTDSYVFSNKYSAIDEYVGGDAYNYIIGASLVAGRISGTMTTKAIFIVGGIICICLGLTLRSIRKKETLANEPVTVNNKTVEKSEEYINNEENEKTDETASSETQEHME